MAFIPMLAATCKDISKLTFPLMASVKLDGVRATVQSSGILSRTLKPIPNKAVQKHFRGLPQGLDGELIYGDPTAPDCYRNTVSIVMSEDKPIDGLCYYIFDRKGPEGFMDRYAAMHFPVPTQVTILEHRILLTLEELTEFESESVAAGHEGVMVRKMDGPYKEGRSTAREGYLLKVKRFLDSEAEVIGMSEKLHNANEAKTNELGRTARSTRKDGMVGTGVLGALHVRDVKTGVEFDIGTGFNDEERAATWAQAPIGRLAKYKYFPTGGKDKPRFPVFLGWRDRRDV